MRRFLKYILVISLVLVANETTAFDGNREGFILGVGPGIGWARNDLTVGIESKFAIKSDFQIGFSGRRTAITWSSKVLWYDSVGATIASGTGGLGITPFFFRGHQFQFHFCPII